MRIQRLSDEAIADQLGNAIRERRLRKDIKQDDLAEAVGVSTPTIQKLEKGKGTLQVLIADPSNAGAIPFRLPTSNHSL